MDDMRSTLRFASSHSLGLEDPERRLFNTLGLATCQINSCPVTRSHHFHHAHGRQISNLSRLCQCGNVSIWGSISSLGLRPTAVLYLARRKPL